MLNSFFKGKTIAMHCIKNFATILLLLISLLLISCTKNEKFEDLDLLLLKKWHLKSITVGGVDSTGMCDSDDFLIFDDASNYSYNYGNLNCYDDTFIVLKSTTWQFREQFTQIRFRYTYSLGTGFGTVLRYWDIVQLNEDILILRENIFDRDENLLMVKTYENKI